MSSKGFFITLFAEMATLEEIMPLIEKEYQTASFTNDQEGLEFLTSHPCNLLIIEVNAITFNGFELKKNARKTASTANLIFVSRQQSVDTVTGSQRHGADYLFYLPLEEKPFQEALDILYRRRNYWMDLLKSSTEKKDE